MASLLRPWKSLSTEYTLVFASLSVALVVLLSYISYQRNARVLEEGIRQELLRTVDQTLEGIDDEIEERIGDVRALTLSPVLRQAALEAARRTESLRLEEADEAHVRRALARIPESSAGAAARTFLEELQENYPYLAEVFVTDSHGINAVSSNPTTDLRQDDETWWQEAVVQRLYLGNLEYDESADVYAFSVALPISDGLRGSAGVVKAVINLKGIQERVNAVRVGRGGYVVVLSRDGRVLSHPDPQYLFHPVGDVPALAQVSQVIRASARGVQEFDPQIPERDGEHWLAGYSRLMRPASLGPLNWTAAALVSRAEVIAPILAVRDDAAMAGLVFILASVPLVVAVSRRLSRPLTDLARRADRIRQGDLDVSLAFPSSDEIGRLASALAQMVDHLKESHRRTLDINAGLEKTVRDRTEELQRKNRQIEGQNKKVMEANRLKSQFLANMSHELRTPLNAVLALSDILGNEMSGPLNDEQRKQVVIINRSGKALLRLINDILDLSKIEAGRMTVERAPMSLPSLVTLVVDTLRPLAEEKGLSLTVSCAPDLPEFVKSDEHKLRQILINLVGNGIKFTERGGVRLEVGYTQKPATISFAILDTGIGIGPDVIDRIFDEFCQGDGSTTRKYGGTGLGLTISKKMAELLGGTLIVASTPGQGTTFTLSVPYEPAPPVPATAAETLKRVRLQVPEPALINTSDDSATALHDGRPVVLVAEDESDNLYIMKKYLNRLDCQVIFARDGNEVVQKARTYNPIAITLDLVLPKKNGWDVLSELKSDPRTRNIPVIIASVLDNQERGFCLGAYRYLVKPVNETDLADTIHQIQWADRKDVKRILVVDDNVVDADLVERLLTEARFQVLRAARGEEGLATAARERPDLIMLDLSMPGMDGFQVMEGLKRDASTRDIPVVIYTAKDLDEEEQERLRRDAQRVFLKCPLEPTRMLSEIGDLLKGLPQPAAPSPPGSGPAAAVAAEAPDPQACAAAPPEPASESARRPPSPDSWNTTAESVARAVSRTSGGMKKILLVEDDPANQYTLEFMLRNEGYEVVVAENGRDGIERAAAVHPDVILMDMMMPVMGGHEATRVLKDTPGIMEIPVIALTAAAMAGDREKALAAGCNDYVSKPVNRDHLLQRIAHWIDLARRASRPAPHAPAAVSPDQP